ncbi:hypothetical protein [Cerasicoccus maritimus]|uniref:hypothetical protein n=1 Tax=Cerasicoccus maritimus TaxID=490089 RepID=UPI002852D4D6|nr:hypothetical protein [Cerasicoccus maritimus]
MKVSLLSLLFILLPSLAFAGETSGGTLIEMSSIGTVLLTTTGLMVLADKRKKKSGRK